jgi:hypothetical protein
METKRSPFFREPGGGIPFLSSRVKSHRSGIWGWRGGFGFGNSLFLE